MSMVISMASRRAVPTIPNVNAVHQMSRDGTSTVSAEHVDAAHMYEPPAGSKVDADRLSVGSPAEFDLVRLHMAAVNALTHALHQLTSTDCSPAMWAAATARANRGLTALKRASALVNQVEG